MKKVLKIFLGIFVFFIIFLAGLYFSRNLIFEAVVEKLGTTAVGALVEVDGANLDLFAGRAAWDRIQVTDKDNTLTNLFETGNCEFDLALKPLTAGKFIIETMEMDGFKTGTKRATDGKVIQVVKKELPKSSKPSWIESYAVKQLEKEKQNIPILDPEIFEKKVDTDKIIAALALITPGNVEKLHIFADERYQFWEKRLKNNDYEKRVRLLRDEVKTIKIDKIKNIDQFQKTISKAEKVIKRSKALRKEIKLERKQLKADLKTIRDSAKSIPDWIKTDYDMALKKAKLADFSAKNISKMLFGDRVTSVVVMALGYIETSRQMSAAKPVVETKPEKEKMPELPGFWIKTLKMSASFSDDINLKGVIKNVSSDQKRTGKPIRIDLGGDSAKTGIVNIRGFMDYTGDKYIDELKLTVNRLPLKNVKLGKSSVFPEKIKSASGNIAAGIYVTDNRLDSTFEFDANNVLFDYSSIKNPEKKASQIAKRVAEKMKKLSVKCSAKAANDTMDFDIESNVDKILSAEIKNIIADEISNAKKDLKQKLNKKIGKYQGEFEKKTGLKEKELNELIALLDTDSAAQDKLIDSKKKTLERKLKKKVEEKSKKAGKKLLKKFKLKF